MKIPVLLSSSGHVIVESPVAAVEYEENVSKKVYKTHTKTASPKTEISTPTPAAAADGTITPTPTPTEKVTPPEVSVETKTVQEKVKKTKNYDLPHEVRFEIPSMSSAAISACQKTIGAAREKEFEKTRVANARNDLEKAVYRLQGELIAVDFLTYASSSERSTAKNQLTKISKFLADTPSDKITAETYLAHLKDLLKVENLVKSRQHEEQERPVAIENLQLTILSVHEFVQAQKAIEVAKRPQTDDELAVLTKKSQEISKWLQEKSKKQASSAKSVDPVLTISDLVIKKTELMDQLDILKAKKMPEPVKVVEAEEIKEPETDSNNETETTEKPVETTETPSESTKAPAETKAAETKETKETNEKIDEAKKETPITSEGLQDLVEERFEL